MGGSSGGGAKSTGSMPYWARGAHEALVGQAENFAFGTGPGTGEYLPYPNIRIAGLTPQEQQANIAREEMFNRGDVAGQFAADQLGMGAGLAGEMRRVAFSEFGEDEYQRRRNPYIDNVVGMRLREAGATFDQSLNQYQASSVARGGSIGSYRVGLENALLEQERAQTMGDIRGQGELEAYNQALSSFERDRAEKLGGLGLGANTYMGLSAGANTLGTDSMNRENQLISELERSGAIQREMSQAELDLAYNDFEEERDWPMRNMNFLSSILSGVPNTYGSTTTTSPAPGLPSQLASLGLGAAAIQKLIG